MTRDALRKPGLPCGLGEGALEQGGAGVGLDDEEIVAGMWACVCTAAAAGGFGVRVTMGCRCGLFFLFPWGELSCAVLSWDSEMLSE